MTHIHANQESPPVFLQAVIYGNPDYYPPMINGAVVLAREGIAQQILCSDFYTPMIPRRVADYAATTRIQRIGSDGKGIGGKYFSFIRQVLRFGDPRAAFFIGYDMHGLLPARLLATRFRRPLVYHCHDYVGPNIKLTRGQHVVKFFERLLARTADLVIVPDRERAEYIKEQLGLRDCPLVVANAPLETPPVADKRLRTTLEARGKRFERVVLRQGHIGRGHGLEQTIRSIPLWNNGKWGFVIIGPGDEDYKQSLRQLAGDIGVPDQFEILPSVTYGEISQFVAGADLGHGLYEPVHVNHRFSSMASNKIMEDIAAELPLLLTDNTGSRMLIGKYDNGIVVENGSVEAIAAAVNAILGDPQVSERFRQGSKRAFQEEFNYSYQYAPAIEKFREFARKRR